MHNVYYILEIFINSILASFFPAKCYICRNPSEKIVCKNCEKNIVFIDKRVGDDFFICEYSGVIEKAIKLLKFHKRIKLGLFLADIVNNHNPYNNFDFIVPVPLHKNRFRERGFNQSEIISYKLSKSTQKAILNSVLFRTKDTKHQFELNKKERKINVQGAFETNKPTNSIIKDSTILIVDDIYTTGSTISECKKELIKNGAKKVLSLILSKATSCDIIQNDGGQE